MTPCRCIYVYRFFGGACCHRIQGSPRTGKYHILIYFPHAVSAVKMEAVVYSETLVTFDQTTRHYYSEDSNVRALGNFNLLSYVMHSLSGSQSGTFWCAGCIVRQFMNFYVIAYHILHIHLLLYYNNPFLVGTPHQILFV
jgi:hypothetical protein